MGRSQKIIEITSILLSDPHIFKQLHPIEAKKSRYIEAALLFMQENCSNRITLKMLSDYLGLTESYCSKHISKYTGMSFVNYLNALRVSNAQRMLVYTELSMTEIMEQVGFTSIQSFNRVFKSMVGCSPSSYRKSNPIW